jgi:glycosyltransferase involved in cell wall biosynthesis
MRIAFFTPLAPLQTALADHSEGLLLHLAPGGPEIDLFVDRGYAPASEHIAGRFTIYPYDAFDRLAAAYDLAVYVMGDNHDFHGYMYDVMGDHPGVVLLHDTDYQHFFVSRMMARGDPGGYRAMMARTYGPAGVRAAERAITGGEEEVRGVYPLLEPILDRSLGAVVYNDFAYREVRRRRPGMHTCRLDYHFSLPPGLHPPGDGPGQADEAAMDRAAIRHAIRERWGLDAGFVVGSFGLFIPDKRIDVCLRAFKRLVETRPDARYLLAGSHPATYDVPALVRRHGLRDRVVLTGWLDPPEFVRHLLAVDVAVHLRYPHIGGTLYTPLRLLGLGQPTILSDIDPLAAFPEGCCVKVAPDVHEERMLAALLARLAADDGLRRAMGRNAQAFIRRHHDAGRIAARHLAFFRQVAAGEAVDGENPAPLPGGVVRSAADPLLEETAATLAGWGVDAEDEELLAPVAAALAGLIPPT